MCIKKQKVFQKNMYQFVVFYFLRCKFFRVEAVGIELVIKKKANLSIDFP